MIYISCSFSLYISIAFLIGFRLKKEKLWLQKICYYLGGIMGIISSISLPWILKSAEWIVYLSMLCVFFICMGHRMCKVCQDDIIKFNIMNTTKKKDIQMEKIQLKVAKIIRLCGLLMFFLLIFITCL